MRIAIVSDPYFTIPPQKYGGSERIIGYIIKGLQELGHDVTLFGPYENSHCCKN